MNDDARDNHARPRLGAIDVHGAVEFDALEADLLDQFELLAHAPLAAIMPYLTASFSCGLAGFSGRDGLATEQNCGRHDGSCS